MKARKPLLPRAGTKRPTSGGLIGVIAHCSDCDWNVETRNGLGLAAQHHDRTGHKVSIEITRVVIYGGVA